MKAPEYPEDSAQHSRTVTMGRSSEPLIGPDVTIIRPGNRIDRLGIPQVWESKYLLKYFALRAIRGRYRPTAMGYGWIVFRPLLLCLVYVGVFGYLVGVDTDPVPFPLFVFVGISLYLFFSGTVSDTASSLANNAGIMSKVYYPRLIVPLTSLLVNVLDLAASFVIVFGLMVVYWIIPDVRVLLFPVFLGAFALLSFAIGLILAAHSIERRDVMLMLPVVMRVMVYAMPCVYPASMVPEHLRDLYFVNPIASTIQAIRWSLLGDPLPPLWSLGLAGCLIVVGLVYGLVAFNRAERTMVDSL